MKRKSLLLAGVIASGLLVGAPATATANFTITPNTTTDEFNGTGNCSLREAVRVANLDSTASLPDCVAVTTGTPGDDTVQLGPNNYVLSVAGPGDDSDFTGDLDRTGSGDLTIDGQGPGQTTISGATSPDWNDRLIQNQATVVGAGGTLMVSDLTLANGNATDGGGGAVNSFGAFAGLSLLNVNVTQNQASTQGGAVRIGTAAASITDSTVDTNSSAGASGGGVYANAATTITRSAIFNNGVSGTGIDGGGGIAMEFNGSLTLTSSVVEQNVAQEMDVGSPVAGGGIWAINVPVTIRGSTISNNTLLGGNVASGGGLLFGSSSGATTLTMVNSTVSGNDAGTELNSIGGASISSPGTSVLVHDTFSANKSTHATGSFSALLGSNISLRGLIIDKDPGSTVACGLTTSTSGGFNIASDASCQPNGTTDVPSVNPQIGALASNGGASAGATGFQFARQTHLPALTSPALDRVPIANCLDVPMGTLAADELGNARPADGDGNGTALCDSGSVERLAPPPPVVTPIPGVTPTTSSPAPAPRKKKCKKKK